MSGGSTNTVTRTELDPAMRPYVQYGLSEAQRLYSGGGPEFYQGQTYVGPSQQTQAALSAMQNRAMQGNILTPQAQQLASQTLTGNFLGGNSYMQAALKPGFDAATTAYQDAINQMRSKASASGRYGTNEALMSQEQRAQGALANAMAAQAGQLGYQSYEAERGRQQQALGIAPGLAAQDYADIGQLAQVGQATEGYQQAALADAIQRFNFQQQQPYANLQSFLSSAYGSPMGMQTVQPSYSNPMAGVLGAALAGKALLS